MWQPPWMPDGFDGLTEVTKVMIYPMCATLLQRAAVLATPIQGPIVTGWQATQLTYKQLRHTNLRYPRYPWACMVEQIKNTSLSGYYPTPQEALR